MMVKFMLFLSSVTMMPIVASMDADTVTEKLAKGTAQFVLSVCVVGLSIALVRMFVMYRRDMRDANDKMTKMLEDHAETTTKLVADNTIAMNNMSRIIETNIHTGRQENHT